MTEPSAEAREQVRDLVVRLLNDNRHVEPTVDDIMAVFARVLAEKDAALARYKIEHERCVDDLDQDNLSVANRENELHAEKDAKIAALEADLAAMRGALDLWDSATNHDVTRLSPSGLCAKESGRKMLASSPGATWLATAREVVEGLDEAHAILCALAKHGDGTDELRGQTIKKLGALLAHPEVQRWAGR